MDEDHLTVRPSSSGGGRAERD